MSNNNIISFTEGFFCSNQCILFSKNFEIFSLGIKKKDQTKIQNLIIEPGQLYTNADCKFTACFKKNN